MNFYLARQPIFDRNQVLIGYEIIYRSSLNSPEKEDNEYNEATSRLLLNSYLDIGMDTLLSGHIAFINFDRELVLKDSPLLLNKSTTIIQIPSDITPDPIFLDKVSAFKDDGYLISLAGYIETYPHNDLLDLVDIIQVDLSKNNASSLKRIVKRFQLTTQILLAKNIESQDSYETLKKMGFELFQGYYFCKPTLTEGKLLQHSNLNTVEILKLSNEHEPNIKEISKRIEEDVNLTIKLLRLVNSSHYFMNKIQSVQHALAMVGIQSFKNWLNIALMDSLLGEQTSEIIKLSMVRMKMMEEIGHICKSKLNTDSLKLIGLLSVLDVLLDKNMMDAVGPLPIERELKMTLLGKDTIYAPIYRLVLGYEKGNFNIAYSYAEKANVDLDALPQIYATSIQWADDLYSHIYTPEEPTL